MQKQRGMTKLQVGGVGLMVWGIIILLTKFFEQGGWDIPWNRIGIVGGTIMLILGTLLVIRR